MTVGRRTTTVRAGTRGRSTAQMAMMLTMVAAPMRRSARGSHSLLESAATHLPPATAASSCPGPRSASWARLADGFCPACKVGATERHPSRLAARAAPSPPPAAAAAVGGGPVVSSCRSSCRVGWRRQEPINTPVGRRRRPCWAGEATSIPSLGCAVRAWRSRPRARVAACLYSVCRWWDSIACPRGSVAEAGRCRQLSERTPALRMYSRTRATGARRPTRTPLFAPRLQPLQPRARRVLRRRAQRTQPRLPAQLTRAPATRRGMPSGFCAPRGVSCSAPSRPCCVVTGLL